MSPENLDNVNDLEAQITINSKINYNNDDAKKYHDLQDQENLTRKKSQFHSAEKHVSEHAEVVNEQDF